MSIAPLVKQPAEIRLARIDFQGLVADLSSVVSTIVTPAGQVAEVDALALTSTIVGTNYVQLRLEGGTAGELYGISVLVEDAAGYRREADVEVLVLDLSFRAAGQLEAQYLTIEQFVARVGIEEAVRLTDDKGIGILDAARLDEALLDAQGMVEGYLAARYAVPLALPAPALVRSIVFDLALARLYREAVPPAVADNRDRALALLRDLADGTAALGVAATTDSPRPVIVQANERRFTRQRMRGL
ncbi:MAG: DUF1320 domain-containing protein [Sphingomonadaceae bacterium]